MKGNSARKVIGFDRNWLSKVEPGKPFSLVMPEQARQNARVRKIEKLKEVEFSIRTLKSLGELLTIKEAAEILKVTDRAVYEWIYEEKLRAIRVGRLIRIAMTDLEEFLSA